MLLRCGCVLTLLACAALDAGEAPTVVRAQMAVAPPSKPAALPRLAWPAGERPLGEAVQAFATAGFPIALGPGVDAARRVALPAVDDGAWAALVVLCRAAALVPDAGVPVGATAEGFVVRAGALTLLPADPALPRLLLSGGGLLLDLERCDVERRGASGGQRRLTLAGAVRLPPDLDPAGLNDSAWAGLNVVGGGQVRSEPGSDGLGRPVLLAQAAGDAALRVRGTLQVEQAQVWRAQVTLAIGATATVDVDGVPLTVALIGAGRPLAADAEGWDGPGVAITVPEGKVRIGDLRAVADGRPLAQHGSASIEGERASVQVWRLDDALGGRAQLTLSGTRVQGRSRHEIDAALELPALAPAAAARPWPAGRMTLAAALAALRAHGRHVVLELGVDEQRQADIAPAVGFWPALLAVCDAFGLQPMPPAEADGPLTSGTVGLGPRGGNAPLVVPAGMFLVEVVRREAFTRAGLAGTEHGVALALRLRCAPGDDAPQEATLEWDARNAEGQAQIEDEGTDQSVFRVRVEGVAPEAAAVQLSGRMVCSGSLLVRGAAPIAPGVETRVALGAHALRARIDGGKLVLRDGDLLANLQPALLRPDGGALVLSPVEDPPEDGGLAWHIGGAADGQLRLELTAEEAGVQLRLPLVFTVR